MGTLTDHVNDRLDSEYELCVSEGYFTKEPDTGTLTQHMNDRLDSEHEICVHEGDFTPED
jgi:hypothetical protein